MARATERIYGVPEFWLKGNEAQLAKRRTLTVIIRQGDRSDRQRTPQQWLPLLEPIPVFFISTPGDQSRNIPAQFEPDEGTTVRIIRRTVTRLTNVTDADLCFARGRAVPKRATEVKQYLEQELAPGRSFGSSDLITIYWIEYLPERTASG